MTRRLRNSPKPSTNVTRNQSEKQIRVVAEEYEYFLNPVELWWRDKYEWLEECGYKLRERYTHKWKPSWMKVGRIDRHEDGFGVPVRRVRIPIALQHTQMSILSSGRF